MILNKSVKKNYLDPAVIAKIKSLELKARLVVEGFKVGLHKSPYHGFSVEFSQYRSYIQGDSIRNIDWNVFGKTEKYFIKQFEEETNLISHICVDTSKSMQFKNKGSVSKMEYAVILASSLLYIMNQQQDAAGLVLYSDKIEKYFPPKSNRIYLRTLLQQLSKIKATNKTETSLPFKEVAQKIKKRGLIIIISDLLDEPDKIIASLKQFYSKKNEVIVFQILDPIERNFGFDKDANFVDMETEEEIITQPHQIRASYQSAFKEYLSKIKSGCLNYGMEYNLIETSQSFDKALISYFNKRKRLH